MTRKITKTWIIYVIALLSFALIAPMAAAKTTITHMHYVNHNTPWYEWLQERAEVFEALNPDIEIEFFLSTGDGVNQLMGMAAGGTMPDVTEMALVNGATLAGRGLFIDLKPFVERDPDVDLNLFAPIAPEAVTWTNGHLWGLPADLYTVPVFFNKDLVAEAGLVAPNQMGDAWNWDAVVDFGRRLSVDTNGDGVFDRHGLTGLSGMWSHMAVVRQAGGWLFDRYKDPQESRFNTPEVEVAIQFLIDLAGTHGVLENGWYGLSEGTSGVDFVSGPSAIVRLNQSGINFDVALQPLGPAGNRAAYSVVNSWQITRDSENPDAAWRWIKFLATDIESMQRFVTITNRLPSYLPVAQYYGDFIPNPPDNVGLILQNVLDPAAFHLPIGPNAAQALALLTSRRAQMLAGTLDVRSALEDAHRQANAILGGN